jgi:aspartyl/asparaginyl beta-hydroxylase (cupin superfamily)
MRRPGTLGPMIRQGTLAYKAIALPGLALLQTTEFVIGKVDGNDPFYAPARFPWVREIESRWQTIRSEFRALRPQLIPTAQQISEEQARITTGHEWKTYVFYAFGRKAADNCARCPETTRLLERIPGMVTAMFSVLAPHAHIRPHRGVYKGVLRYHLGLVVPQPPSLCTMRVGDEFTHWSEGTSVIFDDTHDHEVWNDSDETRVVLILDFLRRLPLPLNLMNSNLVRLVGISPFIRNAMNKIGEWNKRVGDVPYQR